MSKNSLHTNGCSTDSISESRDFLEELGLNGEGVISFGFGALSPGALAGCSEIMAKASAEALNDKQMERLIFQYGPTQGSPELRQELAKFLSSEYGSEVNSSNLLVTSGASSALPIVIQCTVDENLPIFMEQVSFFNSVWLIKNGMKREVIPVPLENGSIDIDAFENILQLHKPKAGDKSTWKTPYWSCLYLMTVYHNPTGRCYPTDKCQKLVELAKKYDILLVSDDIYNLLNYEEGKPPARLCSYESKDEPIGHVVSIGTFSKLFAPGTRLGWIEANKNILQLLKQSHYIMCGGGGNHYTSYIMAAALRMGLIEQRTEHLRKLFGKRITMLCEALTEDLPDGCKFYRPKGGLCVWLELPETLDGEEVQRTVKSKYNVHVSAGEGFSAHQTSHCKNYIRLTISSCEDIDIATGVRRLMEVIKDHINELSD